LFGTSLQNTGNFMNIDRIFKRKEVCEERIEQFDSEIEKRWGILMGHGRQYYNSAKHVGDYIVVTVDTRYDRGAYRDVIHKHYFELEDENQAVKEFNVAYKDSFDNITRFTPPELNPLPDIRKY